MLAAMELLVGRPKITCAIDGVAPTALPIAVFAKAEAATATSSERRVRGFWAQ